VQQEHYPKRPRSMCRASPLPARRTHDLRHDRPRKERPCQRHISAFAAMRRLNVAAIRGALEDLAANLDGLDDKRRAEGQSVDLEPVAAWRLYPNATRRRPVALSSVDSRAGRHYQRCLHGSLAEPYRAWAVEAFSSDDERPLVLRDAEPQGLHSKPGWLARGCHVGDAVRSVASLVDEDRPDRATSQSDAAEYCRVELFAEGHRANLAGTELRQMHWSAECAGDGSRDAVQAGSAAGRACLLVGGR